MKTFYILSINTLLRLHYREEISLHTRRSEATLRNLDRKLHEARSRRRFEAVCEQYGI